MFLQNSFHNQLHKQKKSEKFFRVFYERMEQAQKEIRASVSVNMFELSCRKREEESEGSGIRYKKGTLKLSLEIWGKWISRGFFKNWWELFSHISLQNQKNRNYDVLHIGKSVVFYSLLIHSFFSSFFCWFFFLFI